ncbi:MAG: helix-turn-helix domain-containing protein [Dehalococcoidales bacterium]|nr:helix-turn-helix domain-containing protein [Dehalococcoidales bacterium]
MTSKHDIVGFPETAEREAPSGPNGDSAMLQVKEVAMLLGIHPNTVRIWADSGLLRSYRIGPRKDRRIPLSAVRVMLASK